MNETILHEVGLEEMLAARECRAASVRRLMEQGETVVSLLLNVPGPYKRSALFDAAFAAGKGAVLRGFAGCGWQIKVSEEAALDTGLEARWVLDAPALQVKRTLCEIEQAHRLGRFFDIDVLGSQGAVSRTALGLPERGCMLCGAPGRGCARSRAHTVAQLVTFMEHTIRDYCNGESADKIAALATEALLCEVCTTPKPGLVDRANAGAHRDMDIFTFVKSAAALTPYFRSAALCGAQTREEKPGELLALLRGRGLLAEQQMLAATGGVNTHKGAIFSLGILCAAMGRLDDKAPDARQLLDLCGQIAAPAAQMVSPAQTHGRAAKERYGVGGIRAEAAAGFPSVEKIALPELRRRIASAASLNDAAVAALLRLIGTVEDSNLVTRVGPVRAATLKHEVNALFADQPNTATLLQRATVLDQRFIAENASPGGCADLLAMALLVWLYCDRTV